MKILDKKHSFLIIIIAASAGSILVYLFDISTFYAAIIGLFIGIFMQLLFYQKIPK